MQISINDYSSADEIALQSIIICESDARYASTIDGVLSRYDASDVTHKLYTVKLKSTIIGLILIKEFEPKKAFIWQFLISNPYQNRQYGTIALRLLLDKLKSEKYQTVTTTINKENTRALKVFSKLNFTFASLVKDEMNFTLDLDAISFYIYSSTLTIDKPRELVTSLYTDVSHLKAYQPSLTSIETIKGDYPKHGAKLKHCYANFDMHEKVIHNHLPHVFSQLYYLGDVVNYCENHFEEKNGSTLWTLHVIFQFIGNAPHTLQTFQQQTLDGMRAFKDSI